MIVCEIILASFKFGEFPQNRQFAKLKTSPKFPAIRYIYRLKSIEIFLVSGLDDEL